MNGSAGTLPLAALIDHPTWRDVSVLAGPDPDVQVGHVQLVRDVTADVNPAPSGLVAVLYSAERADWHLDSLLSRCRSYGVRTVVIEGHAPLQASTSALARRLGVAVLGAADVVAAWEAAQLLLRQPALVRAELVLRVLAAVRRAGPELLDVIDAIRKVAGRPVALVDHHGALLAGELDGDHAALASVLGRQNDDARARDVSVSEDLTVVAAPVHAAGTRAWLVVGLPHRLTVETSALAPALSAATAALEQRLAAARLNLERDARQRTSLLGEVLQGRFGEATRRRALDLGWELDGWHIGVRVDVGPDIDLAGRREDVHKTLSGTGAAAVVVEYGTGFDAWLTTAREPSAPQIQQFASALRRAQHQLHETLQTSMGVGRVHEGPEGIARSLSEATDAARLARSRPESGRFLQVDRLGLAQLLLAWTRTDTFEPAARALLEPLRDQPGDLLQTLATYLDVESSITDTAAILGVHRNTVAARVARIESLLGVGLDVPDDRLALHLASRTALGGQDQSTRA